MADRYWVGGAGSWASTTKWSTTSGGASGASVPTSADNAIFDLNSGLTTGTVTITGAATCANLTITANAAGAVVFSTGAAFTISGTLSTNGTAGNKRILFTTDTSTAAYRQVIVSVAAYGAISDMDFRGIRITGAAGTLTGTRIGDFGGNANITFDTPKTVYWNLAGTQIWTANGWSNTSGGAPSTDYFPLPQDTAEINNSSAGTSLAFTTNYPFLCNINASSRTTAITLSLSVATTSYGDFKLGTGIVLTGAGTLTLSKQGYQYLQSNGKAFAAGVTVEGPYTYVSLLDGLTLSGTTLSVNAGTFATNGYSVSVAAFTINNAAFYKRLDLSNSTISLTGNFTDNSLQNTTEITGTYTIVMSNASPTFNGSQNTTGTTYYDLSFTAAAFSTITINGNNTFNNLSYPVPTGTITRITFAYGTTQTINGTLTLAGGAAITTRTYITGSSTASGAPTVSLVVNAWSSSPANLDFESIAISGAVGTLSGTNFGDCGNNSGISFPAPKTVYWNLAGSNAWSATGWATSSGGAPSVNNFPLPQDTAVIDNASAGSTVTITSAHNVGTVDLSSRTTAITFGVSANVRVYGDWKFGTGVTCTGSSTLRFQKPYGTQTITSNGVTFSCSITFGAANYFSLAAGGTYQIADALSCVGLQIVNGSFSASTYNVTATTFSSSTGTTGATVLDMGSGLWTLTGTGTVFSVSSNAYTGTADILLSNTSTSARTITLGGATNNFIAYNKITIGGTTGISTLTINGSTSGALIKELASTKTVAHTIALANGTLVVKKWSVTGTSGNVVSITGSGFGIQLQQPSSGIDYLSIGTGVLAISDGATFYAGANSTSAGTGFVLTAAPAATTRYWVGGTGTWNTSNTANWSTSSGGATGASVPTEFDDVIFDNLSNATAYTVTIGASVAAKNITMGAPAAGNITWAGTSQLRVGGNLNLSGGANITRTFSGILIFAPTTTSATITTNGVTLASAITIYGSSAVVLGSAFTNTSTTQYLGDFDTANYALTASTALLFYGKGTLTLGSSAVSYTSQNTLTISPYMTVSAGTSTITFTDAASFSFGGNSLNNVTFSAAGATTARTISNVSFKNTVGTIANLTLAPLNVTGIAPYLLTSDLTISGTLTATANITSANPTRILVRSTYRAFGILTAYTITAAAVSLTDVDFTGIIGAGAATWSGTRLGDGTHNSGITFPAAKTVYRIGTGTLQAAQWATSSGGAPAAANFPLGQDTAVIDQNSTAGTLTLSATFITPNINASARTSAYTIATSPTEFYGDLILGTGVTTSGTTACTFYSSRASTLTTNGVTLTFPFNIYKRDGSLTLGSALTTTGTTGIAAYIGTFDAGAYGVTAPTVNFNTVFILGISTKYPVINMGSATWTLTGTSGLSVSSAYNTVNPQTANITLTSSTTSTVAGASKSYNKLTVAGISTGAVTFSGNNDFTEIASTRTSAYSMQFGTSVQYVDAWTATGASGAAITLAGSTPSAAATLFYTKTYPITGIDYITLNNIMALPYTYPSGTPDGDWYIGTNSSIASGTGAFGFIFNNAYGANISESSSGVDSISSATSAIILSNISETGSGVDSVDSYATFGSNVSETSSGIDSVDSYATFGSNVSETASGVDSPSTAQWFLTAAAEASSGVDSVASITAFRTNISETGSGVDSISSALTLPASISEASSGVDSISSLASFASSISETSSGIDSVDSNATFGSSISETASGIDSPSTAQWFLTAAAEASSGVDSTAARTTFISSVSETGSGVDSISSALTLPASISEASSGIDSISSLASFASSISETTSGVDSPSTAQWFLTAAAEASSGIDSVLSVVTFASNVSESGSGVDSVASITVFGANISETGSGVDSISSALTLPASISEASSGIDSISSLASFASSISETTSGVDSPSTAQWFLTAAAESSSGIDSTSAGIIYTPSVAETSSGVDSTEAAVTLGGAIAEAATAAETQSGGSFYQSSVQETALAQDTVISFATFICEVITSCTASDLMAARFQWENIEDAQTADWASIANQQVATWGNVGDAQTANWSSVATPQASTWENIDNQQSSAWQQTSNNQ